MGTLIKARAADRVTTEPVEPSAEGRFTLEQLQGYVGGYIEIVHLAHGRLLIINEQGKVERLTYNWTATELAREQGAIAADDFVAGDAVIVEATEVE